MEVMNSNDSNSECDDDACVVATRYGNLDVLRWLHQSHHMDNSNIRRNCCILAAECGHLDILRWFRQMGYIGVGSNMIGYVDDKNEPNNNEYDVESVEGRCCINAARCGQLDVLKWLHQCGYDTDVDVQRSSYASAINNHHVEVITWMTTDGEYATRINGANRVPTNNNNYIIGIMLEYYYWILGWTAVPTD